MSNTRTTISTEHATFEIEREFPHLPANVFAAFSDLESKTAWFGSEDAVRAGDQELDFREGGRERLHANLPDGTRMTYDATFVDIVQDRRIVYSYEMSMGGRRISATIAALEITPTDSGAHLKLTEHGIYLDGLDHPSQRENGTEQLFDALGRALDDALGRALDEAHGS